MKINYCEQGGYEWWQARKGKVSGVRYGQATSGRKNGLLFHLLDERLMDELHPDDIDTEDMQFGRDNEPIACKLYEQESGIKFKKVGYIESDFSNIHMASPDRLSEDESIVLEVKCTQNGYIQIERFFNGVDSEYMPQIKNYFAVSDQIKEVHWVSYCPNTPNRRLVVCKFTRADFNGEIEKGRERIASIEKELAEMETAFTF